MLLLGGLLGNKVISINEAAGLTLQMNFTNSKAGLFSGRWDPGRRGNSALGSTFEDLSPDNACCIFCVTLK